MFCRNKKIIMSDSFASEFKKWLERKTDERNKNEVEESSEESDTDSEYIMNTADNNESDREKYQKHLSSLKDQAPILVDDDDGGDDSLPSKIQQFEDEPPVLEPAPQQLQDYKTSDLGIHQFCPQNCLRNYSRITQMYFRKSSPPEHNKFIKTYKGKAKQLSATCNESSRKHLLKSKDNKRSGNIFDKFHSDSYQNCPPTLIANCACEIMRFHSEPPELEYKHPSHSPDFCAMEADSTSEIVEDKADSLFSYQRLSKNSMHSDVAIECDSTCMLAASPMIVSPASVSNGEIEEVRDSGGGNRDGYNQGSNYSSAIYVDPVGRNTQKEQKLSALTGASNLIINLMTQNSLKSDRCVLGSIEGPESQPCFQLSDVSTCSPAGNSFPFSVITENESNSFSDFPNEPPVLSVISPPLRSHHRSRIKCHTIDSPEHFSRTGKRLRTIPTPQTDVESADISTPPKLTHISDETINSLNSRGKHSKVSEHSKDCHNYLQNKKLNSRKQQQRFNTFPFADLTEHSSHLSEDLHSFIINTSQLSQLQTHMHMLLYQLFPMLRTELDSMSPESAQFMNLLSDLIMLLEQPDLQIHVHDNSSSPPLIVCNNLKQTSISERQISNYLKLDYNIQSTSDKSSLPSPPSPDFQAADIENIFHSDVACLPSYSSVDNTSHHCTQKQHSHLVQESDLLDHDFVTPQLSRMTLKEVEDCIRPSSVLLFRDPGALLKEFSQLSCKALQLLLPDLTVRLCNELSGSPNDLVIFIDNVILTNSRQKSKH